MPALRELGRITLVILGSTLSLLVIATFFQTALEMAEAWWELLIGLPVAAGFAIVALAIIFASMSSTVGITATGWLGMFAGRVPPGYGRGDHNLGRGLGALAVFGATTYLGLSLYRIGTAGGELNWALEGLFLFGAGLVFGLAAAIPRFFFASRSKRAAVSALDLPEPRGASLTRRGRGARKSQTHPEAAREEDHENGSGDHVAILFTLGMFGIALSMCTVNTVTTFRARDGRATLAYNDWLAGCIARTQPDAECAADARLRLAPRAAGLLRVEVVGSCPAVLLTAAGEPVRTLTSSELKARSIPRADPKERVQLIFQATAEAEYRVELEPDADGSCFYSVRYLDQVGGPGPVAEKTP